MYSSEVLLGPSINKLSKKSVISAAMFFPRIVFFTRLIKSRNWNHKLTSFSKKYMNWPS